MSSRILDGDCRAVLPTLAAGSVQCVVTSPPYFGLRDYGVGGQIGLEASPDAYIAEMVEVFGLVRRVLREDGTLWLNLGDSYSGGGGFSPDAPSNLAGSKQTTQGSRGYKGRQPAAGYKSKDLLGIPWRVALALQADGWYLRSAIVWHKPNPMPESVTDRPTSAYEHVFLLAKGQWSERAVKLSDLRSNDRHLSRDCRQHTPDMWADKFGVCLASAILDCTQIKEKLGDLSLDTQVRQKLFGAVKGASISGLPAVDAVAAYAASLLYADTPAKEFLCKLYSLGLRLGKANHLLIGGCDIEVFLSPSIYVYGEATIAIHDAGQIGKFDFCHGQIIACSPSTCTYYYDAAAIAEEAINAGRVVDYDGTQKNCTAGDVVNDMRTRIQRPVEVGTTRNARNVWTIATQPYSEAHFATFPPELAERCIKAGSKPGDTVLDPFAGAGTTLLAADRLQRDGIGIELNPAYAAMARNRIAADCPLLASAAD